LRLRTFTHVFPWNIIGPRVNIGHRVKGWKEKREIRA